MTLREFTGGKEVLEYNGMRYCFSQDREIPYNDVCSYIDAFISRPFTVHCKNGEYSCKYYNDHCCDREGMVDNIRVWYKSDEVDIRSDAFRNYVKKCDVDKYRNILFFFVENDGSFTVQPEYFVEE